MGGGRERLEGKMEDVGYTHEEGCVCVWRDGAWVRQKKEG